MRTVSARTLLSLLMGLLLLPAGQVMADDKPAARGELPDLKTLTRVPVASPSSREEGKPDSGELDEAAWRSRFRTLRGKLERKERVLTLKRAELYDKIEQGKTEKKPRRFAIEGFVINTEKTGDEPKFIDPLEREVYERDKEVQNLRRELRELEFEASVAGVPKDWRH